MYSTRPRVCFGGCYISKMSYVRDGELGFQDQYYFPWHKITYYRYIRFFVNGTVIMLTTADKNAKALRRMQSFNTSDGLKGSYSLQGDRLTINIRKDSAKQLELKSRGDQIQENKHILKSTFTLEFKLSHSEDDHKPQLIWQKYLVSHRLKSGNPLQIF